jgi:hypothetical protein
MFLGLPIAFVSRAMGNFALESDGPCCYQTELFQPHIRNRSSKMKWRAYRKAGREDGQSIVEAAIVIPLFILILCGILDFGWIMASQLKLNNCSREGARYAVVNSSATNLTDLVKTRVLQVSGVDSPSSITVIITKTSQGDYEVKVRQAVRILTPLAGIFVQNQTIVLQSVTTMRIG